MTDKTYPTITATALGVDPGLRWTGIAGVSRLSDGRLLSRGVSLVETYGVTHRSRSLRKAQDDERRMRDIYSVLVQCCATLQPQVLGVEQYTTRVPKAWERLRSSASRLCQIVVPRSYTEFMNVLSDTKYAAMWIESLGALAQSLHDTEGFEGMGLGQAAKSIGVQWIAASVAWGFNAEVEVFTPTMLKVHATNMPGASKETVGRSLERRVIDLASHVDQVRCRTDREDPESDAAEKRASHVYDAAGHAIMALEKWEERQVPEHMRRIPKKGQKQIEGG